MVGTPPAIRKRLIIGRPLTAEEHDSNLDAVVHRGNHTGTQLSSTISDLSQTVQAFSFIQTLLSTVADLEQELQDLQAEIVSDSSINNLVNIINGFESDLLVQENAIAQLNTSLTTLNSSVATKVDRATPNQSITANLRFAPPNTGTPTTPFTVNANANAMVVNLNADTVDGIQGDNIVLRSGSTMTGPLVLSGDPVAPAQAANRGYIDGLVNPIRLQLVAPNAPAGIIFGIATVVSGLVRSPLNDTLINLAGLSVNLLNNNTTLIYVDSNGSLRATASGASGIGISSVSIPIALITTLGNAITSVTDLSRHVGFTPTPRAVRTFGASNQALSVLSSGFPNESLATTNSRASGEYFTGASTFTGWHVFRGTTIIRCSGALTLSATCNLIVLPEIDGAGGPVYLSHMSGAAGYGLAGGRPGYPVGSGYSFLASPVGSSGGTGTVATASASTTVSYIAGEGGRGGGCLIIEALGPIVIEAGATLRARGSDAGLPFLFSTTGIIGIGGSGGGSGGRVSIRSATSITIRGTIDVTGGRGANGHLDGGAGGGGGGGWVDLTAPIMNNTLGTFNVLGGSPGAYVGAGTPASTLAIGASGGGFAGVGGFGGVPSSNVATAGDPGRLFTYLENPSF